jgi:dTDP-4-dehydrorhamnose 3,5-epimerase
MRVDALSIPDVKLISLRRFTDARGSFSETYNKKALAEFGITAEFVQDNFSVSHTRFTIRGIHFQTGAFAQGKLIQVLQGAVLDVCVDLRPRSATFMQHVLVELSADKWTQLWIPRGFGHAFCTLGDDTMFAYKVDAPYSADHESGILWNDTDLNIAWPCRTENVTLSNKDARLPRLSDISSHLNDWFPSP